MTRHYLTMTTNDAHDFLRCSCACGYDSGERPVAPDADWKAIHQGLIDEARAYHAERGEEV